MRPSWIDESGYCSVHQSYHCGCYRPTEKAPNECIKCGKPNHGKILCEECNKEWQAWAVADSQRMVDEFYEEKAKMEVKLGDCLDEAKATICGERQDVYGSPEDSFAVIAQYWEVYLQEYKVCSDPLSAKDIAHMMVLFKMARIQGQKPSRDSYVDICGYAAIAADRLGN